MRTNRFLATALTAFGVILGVPALADDPSSSTAATNDESLDVYVVDATPTEFLLCVEADAAAAGLPCAVRTDTSTVALVTLDEGLNYIVVPGTEPVVVQAFTDPDTPGIN
jgi:hypothetical protein